MLLAADLGAAFGAAASVLPVGGAWTRAASALGLSAATAARFEIKSVRSKSVLPPTASNQKI